VSNGSHVLVSIFPLNAYSWCQLCLSKLVLYSINGVNRLTIEYRTTN
ncbi:1247_t:CDS:1, partial [Entrophospora sp. SA101]